MARNYKDATPIDTPLGPVRIIDSRDPGRDTDPHRWEYAEIAEARFNYDPEDRNDFNGKFTINRAEYAERVDISRNPRTGISVSTGRFGRPLTEAAQKRLIEILKPLVEQYQERKDMEDLFESVEGYIRGRVRSALHSAVRDAERELAGHGMTYYGAKNEGKTRTDAELQRAHDMAVRVINEEVGKLSTVRTLSAGFEDRD